MTASLQPGARVKSSRPSGWPRGIGVIRAARDTTRGRIYIVYWPGRGLHSHYADSLKPA